MLLVLCFAGCDRQPAMHAAAARGDLATLRRHVEGNAQLDLRDAHGYTAIHVAARENQVEAVDLLIQHGISPSIQGPLNLQPIHLAAREGHTRMVRHLLDSGVPVNTQDLIGATPLHWAADQNQMDVARLLLDCGADVQIRNTKRETAEDVARKFGHEEMVELLRTWEPPAEQPVAEENSEAPHVRTDFHRSHVMSYIQED